MLSRPLFETSHIPDVLTEEQLLEQRLQLAEQEMKLKIEQADEYYRAKMQEIDEAQAKAEIEKEALFANAKQTGYQQGLNEGREKGEVSYNDQLQLAQDIVVSVSEAKRKELTAYERDLKALAFAIGAKITKQKMQDEGAFLPIIEDMLREVKEAKAVKLFVHPNQFTAIATQKESLIRFGQQLEIYPDKDMDELSCLIETPFGKVDASIDSQLTELRKALELPKEEVDIYEALYTKASETY